jgi:hypothetical protein
MSAMSSIALISIDDVCYFYTIMIVSYIAQIVGDAFPTVLFQQLEDIVW